MQRSAKVGCACIVGFSLLCPITSLVASAGQGERLMPYRASPPIAQRLHPDDRVVIVKRTESTHSTELTGGTEPEEWVFHAVAASEAAALVTVTEIVPDLVDRGTWLETDVWVGIDGLIFSDVPELYQGANIAIHHNGGGEKMFDGVLVKAGVPLNIRRGGTYMVFLARDPDRDGRWYLQSTMLAVEDDRLVDTWRAIKPIGVREPFANLKVGRAKQLVDEAVKEKQRRRAGR